MWLILGATLGLAALVNHERRRSLRVDLGPPMTFSALTVRLPESWDVVSATESDPRIVVRATEPPEMVGGRAREGRVVTVLRARLPAARGPLEHLLISISQTAAVHGPPEWADAIEGLTIGGWPGLMVELTETEPGPQPSKRAAPRKTFVACAVLPSRHAVVIRLEGGATNDLSDLEILRQIAAAIEITGQPPLGQPGETVALEGGARVTAPQGFRPVYETDPNRIERQLWGIGDARSWTSCELVPLVLASETPDETQAIATALQARDRRLRDANISPEGPRRWRVDLHVTPFSELFPSTAYVIADDHSDRGAISSGPRRAVLAVFRGAPGTQERFAEAWESIARGVSFVGDTHYAAMLATGESEARRLQGLGMARLLRAPRQEQWWLWFDQHEHVHLGWSNVEWDLAGDLARDPAPAPSGVPPPAGNRQTHRRGGDGRLVRVRENWTGDLSTYTIFSDTAVGDGSEAFDQTTRLEDGKLVTDVVARGKRIASFEQPAPPQYVPGGWLALLIGELTRQPMILRTESFIRHEGSGPPRPMTLIITHSPETTTRSTVDDAPLRCVTVQVNGSGELSRWYFRPDGSIDRIDFAAGLQMLPSDAQTVSFTFKHDESMKP